MEAELGLCSERKGGNLECNKLLSDGKPKRVNGNGIEICPRCHGHTVSTTVLGYKPKIPRESAFEKSLITFMPLLFTVIYFKKF